MRDKKIIGLYELPDFITVGEVYYTLKEVPSVLTQAKLEEGRPSNLEYLAMDEGGQLPGQELLDSVDSNKNVENEDVPGFGFLPNTKFAKFKVECNEDGISEKKLIDSLTQIALNLQIPSIDQYYNKQGKELELADYQASLNYLVAREYGLNKLTALVNAFAARHSMLPKRIRDKNGYFFPELYDEQRKLVIFEKLNHLLFKGVFDEQERVIHPAIFEGVKRGDKIIYTALMTNGGREELPDKYNAFLGSLKELLHYINDDPNDDKLKGDDRANLVEAVDLLSLYVLPSHLVIEGHSDSRDPHTVEKGLKFLKSYGGSYSTTADLIKRICYDHID